MTDDALTEVFESHRGLLFGVAYRMLGSATDAEDIVQESFLRFRQAEEVRLPKPFLVTTVTRLCLDQMKSAREQREQYFGSWLPEPVETELSPQEQVIMSESISMAFMVLLESLTPVERAVYLLREVFNYEYGEIATIVGKSETACRQVFHRAKSHVVENRPRYEVTPDAHRRVVEQFMTAVAMGDLDGIRGLLAEDIQLVSDGGGKASVVNRPLSGKDVVGKFMWTLGRGYKPEYMAFEVRQVNGEDAFLLLEHGVVTTLIHFENDGERIHAIRTMRNPDKLKGLQG